MAKVLGGVHSHVELDDDSAMSEGLPPAQFRIVSTPSSLDLIPALVTEVAQSLGIPNYGLVISCGDAKIIATQ